MGTPFLIVYSQSIPGSCRFLPTRHYEDRKLLMREWRNWQTRWT